ncbi:MAG: hypothetical protein MZW92_02800 [Comamonadaceae bacterium]|nr:hypothetical protein [Comamonadaceae bacterium]
MRKLIEEHLLDPRRSVLEGAQGRPVRRVLRPRRRRSHRRSGSRQGARPAGAPSLRLLPPREPLPRRQLPSLRGIKLPFPRRQARRPDPRRLLVDRQARRNPRRPPQGHLRPGFRRHALAEYYKATRDRAALDAALQTFHRIERVAATACGAYKEEFDEAWRETPAVLLTDGVKDATYSTNTLLHLLEAFSNLASAAPYPDVVAATRRLLGIFLANVRQPDGSLRDVFRRALRGACDAALLRS